MLIYFCSIIDVDQLFQQELHHVEYLLKFFVPKWALPSEVLLTYQQIGIIIIIIGLKEKHTDSYHVNE